MAILDTSSLAATIDAVIEAQLFGLPIDDVESDRIVQFVVSRQNAGNCYRGMFAATDRDRRDGFWTFTGERYSKSPDGAAGHILGEETCRLLRVLGADDPRAIDAADRAFEQVGHAIRCGKDVGWYCCSKCSVALWRHLASWRTDEAVRWLDSGIALLRDLREPGGRWRRAPFYYAVSALSEVGTPIAREELRYVAPVCERLAVSSSGGPFAKRRRAIVERALSMV